MKPTRRQVVAPALAGILRRDPPLPAGGYVMEGQDQGHRLRDRAAFAPARERRRSPVVIVGGGIAGLSAAWHFQRRGFHDFVVLEMERDAGGNSRWGENEVSRYPWAAHYLPVPGPGATLVRELCADFGLLRDGQFDERWLCHSPKERLYLHGRWQEGIEPSIGLTRKDAAEFQGFERRMAEFEASGCFRIPMEVGLDRCGPRERALDSITFGEWMRREGFHSDYLRWLADYSVRDDYCVRLDGASAWAGIHYFAARDSEEKGPLAWPEGNGWLTQRLLERAGPRVHTGSLVYGIRQEAKRWLVYTERTLWEADFVIFAAPTWLANWLLDPPPPAWPLEYGPWLVANLTLDRWPENRGVDYCWDNVVYDSPTLGYVVATHQNLTTHQPRTVWTFYWALADGRAADQRRVLLGGTWSWWAERILADLERVHPDIRQCVRRLDIFRAAHAMPRPGPGAIFHPERLRRAKPSGSFVYANSDLSALSLFEEALHRGVTAAAHILRGVG